MGGGTGLSTVLSGLKHYVGKESLYGQDPCSLWIESLTAVVTVTDDGGSSGRLREEFQILPPGDIRNCMVALAEDEHLLTRLFQYRFESDGDLSGHSFGNLFLTALTGVTGDFLDAIKASSEVLAIKGRIFPATIEDVTLLAELDDGRLIEGETHIVESRGRIKQLKLSKDCCHPLPETLEAITQADIITIGPGSLYTSIIPNLLVDGIVDAMRRSSALKVYICNIMTQPGETVGFTVEDHLQALIEYSAGLELDYVLVNNTPITESLREKYRIDGASQVMFNSMPQSEYVDGLKDCFKISLESTSPFKLICRDLLNESGVVRHDPHKLAALLLESYHKEHKSARFTSTAR
jgi:uncharacterized cofD-like protein